jgi:hypothetical protein
VRALCLGSLLLCVPQFGVICRTFLGAIILACTVSPAMGHAQQSGSFSAQAEFSVDRHLQQYVRALQVLGVAPLEPWSLRAFSPAQLERLVTPTDPHPWQDHALFSEDECATFCFSWIAPRGELIYNSTFPYGMNDGPVWAGRGGTGVLQAGFSSRYGPLSLTFAPLVFRTQNRPFPLTDNGESGRLRYADARFPGTIDRPQRFGESAFGRVDPGATALRLDAGPVSLGVSTAAQEWGPATTLPLILGNNAGGFFHGFVGTSTPLRIGIGALHGRVTWGRLQQSDFAVPEGRMSERFGTGAIVVFLPHGLPGLELGVGRFFHLSWPEDGLVARDFTRPFQALFKGTVPATGIGSDDRTGYENQLASGFARWVFPRAGVEAYGEYARNDHSWDLRDFLLEPEQNAAYMVGITRSWQLAGNSALVLNAEILNGQRVHLEEVRHQGYFYVHFSVLQGHTQRGQILGSPAAYGGAGSVLGATYFSPAGIMGLRWDRELRQERDGAVPDALNVLTLEKLYFSGVGDFYGSGALLHNTNRNFSGDATGIRLSAGMRVRW